MHRILERQIRQSLGEHYIIPREWQAFLELVSDTYTHLDDDRTLLNRSLEISSKEFFENNQLLKESRAKVESQAQNLAHDVAKRTKELDVQVVELENVRRAMTNLLEDFEEKQKALDQTRVKDEAILSSIADGCIVVDKTGIIILINQMAQKMLGYTSQECIGKPWHEILHRTDENGTPISSELGAIRAALSTTTTTTTKEEEKHFTSDVGSEVVNYYYVRRDNTKFPVDITVAPVILHNTVIGAVEVFRDLTDRKKEEERLSLESKKSDNLARDLEKFKLAVDNVSDAIVITDPEGIVIYTNHAVEKMTGYKISEVVGKKSGALWKTPMPAEYYQKLWETIKIQKKVFVGEIKNKRRNGQTYISVISISPILNQKGKIAFFVGIERDITKEKEIDRAKTEFVSLASHQLRTPLTSINWYIEMLQSGDAGALNDKQNNFLSEIYKGSKRMVQLVNDLLSTSRLETGRLKIEPVLTDLKDFITEVQREVEQLVHDTNCHISLDFPSKANLEVKVDKILLRQVIVNLLTNAIRYSSDKKQGQVLVSVAVNPKDYIISVKDDGIGIPQEAQPRIFEKFFRAENARLAVADGSGLGLYLAKQIMETSGGTIGFTTSGQGSIFYVTIPISGMVSKDGEKGLTG